MKRTRLNRYTPLRAKTALGRQAAACEPAKARKAMKRRRSKPRHWEQRDSRKAAVEGKACLYCKHGITRFCSGGDGTATEPDHYLRKQFKGADDSRLIIPACHWAHDAMHRLNGHEHRVFGLAVQLRQIEESYKYWERDDNFGFNREGYIRGMMLWLQQFIESLDIRGFKRFTVLQNWLTDGTLSEGAKERAREILASIGMDGE